MKKLTKRAMEAYCGDLSQLFGIQECILQGGKAKGLKAYRIHNGCGLEMLVLVDKFFTIAELRILGVNAGLLTKSGICGPEFFQEDGARGFLRTFEAGFLTTCGLTYMGTPGEEDGEKNGLHGVISNTPPSENYYRVSWEEDAPWLEFGGTAREGHLFGPNITITRDVRISTSKNEIFIHDVVENHSFEETPLMLLYHFNLGYPMLDETCKLYTSMTELDVRDEDSRKGLDKVMTFEEPSDGYEEEVFQWKCAPEVTKGCVAVFNEKLNKTVIVHFNPQQLPILNEWRSPRSGDYGLGIEPGTCHVGGRIRAKKEDTLMYIAPGEQREFDLKIEFIEGSYEE